MDEIKSKFQCASCHRGILNRSAERCLFCGELLPAGVRLSGDKIAAREAAAENLREEQRRQWVQPEPQSQSRLDGLGDAIDLLGDL